MRTRHLLLALPFAGLALAQQPPAVDHFAPPVRLQAGKRFLGADRLFPSPVFHDVNGDGLLDVVVGDLPGKLTVALRKPGAAIAFAADTRLLDTESKQLDFSNW